MWLGKFLDIEKDLKSLALEIRKQFKATMKREKLTPLEFTILESIFNRRISGYDLIEKEDLQEDFAKHMDVYVDILQKAKPDIVAGFGEELYAGAEEGVLAWQKAAKEKKVGRGLWIAKKP